MSVLITSTDLSNDLVVDGSSQVAVNIDGVCLTRNGSNELTAAKSVLSGDIPNNSLVLTHPDSTSQTVDLTPIINSLEIVVDGGSYDPVTMNLTLTDNSGTTPDVVIPLAGLLGVSADAGNLLANGSEGKPLLTSAVVCATVQADCVANPGTPCTDLAGNTLGYFIAA